MVEQRPQMREALERLEPVRVDEHLEDGEGLDLAGGTRVIFTPGHLTLYLQRVALTLTRVGHHAYASG